MAEQVIGKEQKCPMCGGTNTEKESSSENSYGETVHIYLCKDCDVEFESKR